MSASGPGRPGFFSKKVKQCSRRVSSDAVDGWLLDTFHGNQPENHPQNPFLGCKTNNMWEINEVLANYG
jgi:hypothetical protein